MPLTPHEWHKCPKCNGQGLVNRPPYVAGDQEQWYGTSVGPWPCSACQGTGILWGKREEVEWREDLFDPGLLEHARRLVDDPRTMYETMDDILRDGLYHILSIREMQLKGKGWP